MENHRISTIFAIAIILLTPVLCQDIKFRSHYHKIPYKLHHYDEDIANEYGNEKDIEFVKKFAQASSRHESGKRYEMELTDDEVPHVQERSADCNDEEKCKDGKDQDRRNDFMDLGGIGASKKTTNIALKAAQEAKAAEEAQEGAGKEASKQAKFQLAEKAIQAAKAAQAALSAKQAILDELERELREAEMVVQDLSSSIQQSEANANAALKAYQQAQTQLKMLTELIQVAQSTVGNGEQAAQGSQQELNEKTQLLEAAKNRVEKLLRELKAARGDFTNTKKEAYKASMAAKEAKQNA